MEAECGSLPYHLKDLVSVVPELVQKCKAHSTVQKYSYGFCRWKNWVIQNSLGENNIFPVNPFHLSLYLAFLAKTNCTVGSVTDAFYSIKWAHDMAGLPSPTDQSSLVKNVFEGAKRTLSHPVKKKEPMTASVLQSVYNAVFQSDNLYSLRLLTMVILSYCGFLRCGEVLCLRRSDIQIRSTHAEIFIEHSKTDIYRDGAWVILSRLDSRLCPVRNLHIYFEAASIMDDSEEYLFRNVTKTKDKYMLRKANVPMTYSRFRELFIEHFSPHVPNIRNYGLHSLRAGGATSAANNGIPDRLFKRHGRWRSETAKDGYVKDKLTDLLSVSKNLNL